MVIAALTRRAYVMPPVIGKSGCAKRVNSNFPEWYEVFLGLQSVALAGDASVTEMISRNAHPSKLANSSFGHFPET